VKVRDALMDIKVLREVDRNGWSSGRRHEGGIPFACDQVTKVFAALRSTAAAACELQPEEFIDELAVPSGRIRAIACTNDEPATPWAGAWPSFPTLSLTANRRARSPSNPRTPLR
jgi:hypothetical protein